MQIFEQSSKKKDSMFYGTLKLTWASVEPALTSGWLVGWDITMIKISNNLKIEKSAMRE